MTSCMVMDNINNLDTDRTVATVPAVHHLHLKTSSRLTLMKAFIFIFTASLQRIHINNVCNIHTYIHTCTGRQTLVTKTETKADLCLGVNLSCFPILKTIYFNNQRDYQLYIKYNKLILCTHFQFHITLLCTAWLGLLQLPIFKLSKGQKKKLYLYRIYMT